MDTADALIAAVAFFWLGMVVAISFLEAPLKFRAPDVTLRIGLGIGRIVFRALNIVEAVLAVVLVAALIVTREATTSIALGVAVAILAVQLGLVRPALTRRSNTVLAGENPPRSRAHHSYVALEVAKVLALTVGGIAALAG